MKLEITVDYLEIPETIYSRDKIPSPKLRKFLLEADSYWEALKVVSEKCGLDQCLVKEIRIIAGITELL